MSGLDLRRGADAGLAAALRHPQGTWLKPRRHRRPRGQVSLRRPAWRLGLLLLATYAYFMPAPAWNEISRFDLVRSLVERGRLDIDPYHPNTEDKAFRDGHYYSDKAPGAALLAVPAYAAYLAWLRCAQAPLPQAVPESVLARGPAPPAGAHGRADLLNAAFRRAVYLCNLSTNVPGGRALRRSVVPAAGAQRGGGPRALACTLALCAGLAVLRLRDDVLRPRAGGGVSVRRRSRCWRPSFEQDGQRRALAAVARPSGGGRGAAGAGGAAELPGGPGRGRAGGVCLRRACRRRAGARPGAGWRLGLAAAAAGAGGISARRRSGTRCRPGTATWRTRRSPQGMAAACSASAGRGRGRCCGMLLGRTRGLLYLSPVLLLGFVGLARGLRASSAERWRCRCWRSWWLASC